MLSAWLPSIVVALISAGAAIYVDRLRRKGDDVQRGIDVAESAFLLESPLIDKITSLERSVFEERERARAAEKEMRSLQQSLDELQEEYERLHRLVYETQVGVAVMSPALVYLYVNELGASLNGLPRQDHIGRTIEECMPYLAKSVTPILREVVNQQVVKKGAVQSRLPDGRPVTWAYHYAPVVRDGVTLALVANFRLISDEVAILKDPLE